MKRSAGTKWLWAAWFVTVVVLVTTTAMAQPAEPGAVVGPVVGGATRKPWQRSSPKKMTELAPGESKIDLNSASVEELMKLPSVGRKRAEQIIALRTKRPFRRVLELRRVRGIGKKTMQRLLPLVSLGAQPPAAKVSAKPRRKTVAKKDRD